MRYLIAFLITFNCLAQSSYYYPDGRFIEMPEGEKSINDVLRVYFPDVELTNTYLGEGKCNDIAIVFKKYTKHPLFVNGPLKKERQVKKCAENFNIFTVYNEFNLKSDLNRFISEEKNTDFIMSVFGYPRNKTTDKDKAGEIEIYNYKPYYDIVDFDLVFVDGVLTRYVIYKI